MSKIKIQKEIQQKLIQKKTCHWEVNKKGSLIFNNLPPFENVQIIVKKHKNGLIVQRIEKRKFIKVENEQNKEKKDNEKRQFKYILPGEISFKDLTELLTSEIPPITLKQSQSKDKIFPDIETFAEYTWREHKLQISQALLQSGIWKKRGKSDPLCEAPKSFWKKISIEDAIRYDAYLGPRQFWKNFLVNENTFYYKYLYYERNDLGEKINGEENFEKIKDKTILDETLNKIFEKKDLPDIPWAIRKWENFSLKELEKYAKSGITKSKKWGYFATNCSIFFNTLNQHNVFSSTIRKDSPYEKIRENFLEILEHWPKTPRGNDILNKAFNQGMGIEFLVYLQPETPRELEKMLEIWKQFRDRDIERLHLNDNYVPPDVELKDGWKYVDHTIAHSMSDKYNCCFSNSEEYINKICEGNAFATYRPDGGGLAYFEQDTDRNTNKTIWIVRENKAYGNEQPTQERKNEMIALARTMSIVHPEPFPEVIQDLEKELQAVVQENKKYEKLIAVAKTNIHRDWKEAENFCRIRSVQELLEMSEKFDIETFQFIPISNKEKENIENKNKKAEKLLAIDPVKKYKKMFLTEEVQNIEQIHEYTMNR